MCTLAKEYIVELFEKKASTYEPVISVIKPLVIDFDNAILTIPFTKDEFTEAMLFMHLGKFPDPDELNPIIYENGCLLFFRAKENETQTMKHILFVYEAQSGQLISQPR